MPVCPAEAPLLLFSINVMEEARQSVWGSALHLFRDRGHTSQKQDVWGWGWGLTEVLQYYQIFPERSNQRVPMEITDKETLALVDE